MPLLQKSDSLTLIGNSWKQNPRCKIYGPSQKDRLFSNFGKNIFLVRVFFMQPKSETRSHGLACFLEIKPRKNEKGVQWRLA